MSSAIRLVSTDFDGTLFAEFENPPVPLDLEIQIERLQALGVSWVINTGRDMSSLMEALGRARLRVHPNFLVLVEREIYQREGTRFVALEEWNHRCHDEHEAIFSRVRPDLDSLILWIEQNFDATLYDDPFSPLCLIARTNEDAEKIVAHLEAYAKSIPMLTVVRNDVYARFSHKAFNKGTALAHITKRLGLTAKSVFAAGDHLNDLPMLRRQYAHFLAAPANAIEVVKTVVSAQQGYVSHQPCGKGVARALEFFLEVKGAKLPPAP